MATNPPANKGTQRPSAPQQQTPSAVASAAIAHPVRGHSNVGRAVPGPGPAQTPAHAASPRPSAKRSGQALLAPVTRALAALDGRLLHLAATALGPAAQVEALVEIWLLASLRRGLAGIFAQAQQAGDDQRIDTVLAESILAEVDLALATVAELESGQPRRAVRCLQYARELAAQLAAIAGSTPAAALVQKIADSKRRVESARSKLLREPGADASLAMKEAHAISKDLLQALNAASPRRDPSLLDTWLNPGASVAEKKA